MRSWIGCLAILALWPLGCDDTARAVDEESREQATDAKRSLGSASRDAKREVKELKREVEATADELRKDATQAVDQAAREIDAVDKSVADDVRDGDAKKR